MSKDAHWLATGIQDLPNQGQVTLSHRFIAFVIDFRLACDPTDPNVVGTPVQPLCGWNFQTPDGSDTRPGGAAIHDVEDALAWVRTNYLAQHGWAPGNTQVLWDTKNVMAAGASSGGNLTFMAAALGTGASRPDAVAGWSAAATEAQQASNTAFGCDGIDPGFALAQSDDPMACWTATNNYAATAAGTATSAGTFIAN